MLSLAGLPDQRRSDYLFTYFVTTSGFGCMLASSHV